METEQPTVEAEREETKAPRKNSRRDPEKYRAYMREYMRKRRAKPHSVMND